MVIASIDIGSNGIRLQVVRVIEVNGQVSFKKLEYIRFPLRLGKTVFETGKISKEVERKFQKLMTTFNLVMELYEVEHYFASATSAMREAKNSKQLIARIEKITGVKIHVITGSKEAEILSKAILPFLSQKTYVHIDVGGGSTEINVYINKIRIKGKSFKIGTVRILKKKEKSLVMNEMLKWVKNATKDVLRPITALGTGGNIKKLFALANQKHQGGMSRAELRGIRGYLTEFSFEERVTVLKLNPDRADVILPAADLYIKIMKTIKSDHILVPSVGLKDGLLHYLYEEVIHEKLETIEHVGM